MKSYIILLAAFALNNLHAQHMPTNTTSLMLLPEWTSEYHNLRGNVKHCELWMDDQKTQEWTFAKDKGLEKHVLYEDATTIFSSKIYTYNAQNQLEKMENKYKGETAYFSFVFDKQGRLVEQMQKGKGGSKTTWSYDKDGRLTDIGHYFNNRISSTYSIEYDDQGRVLRESDFKCASTGNCDFSSGTSYSYTGELLTEKKTEGLFTSEETFNYDAQGRLVSSKTLTVVDGSSYASDMLFEYDDQNRISRLHYNTESEHTTTEYQYDAQGNWIQMNVQTKMGDELALQKTVTRKIVYFE